MFLICVVFHSNHNYSITGHRSLKHIHLTWVRIRRKNPCFVQHLQFLMKTFPFDDDDGCIVITVIVSVSLGWKVEPTSTLYFRKWGFKQSLRKHLFLVYYFWNVDLDSSFPDEVTPVRDHSEAKKKVQALYNMRLNRYKMRLSAMYPECSESGTVNLSRIRSSTMMEMVAYLDVPTQLNLKLVNRYFRKLVKISHSCVSLDASSGWIDAIHLSTFLKRINLVGEPREGDLKEFTSLLRNDGFMELNSLGLYFVGEWALLEILDALCCRIQREKNMDMISNSFNAEIVIQENEFSPFFASKFASLCNSVLSCVLSRLTFILRAADGLKLLFRSTKMAQCQSLVELDLHNVPLGRDGFEVLAQSLWPLEDVSITTTTPPLKQLLLSNTHLTDSCMVSLALAAERGLLGTLERIDLSQNALTCAGMEVLIPPLSNFLCPNLRSLNPSENIKLGNTLTPWILALSKGVCPMLECLQLNHCNIGVTEVDALGVFLSSSFSENMTLLDVGNNPEIAPALSQFFQCLLNSPCTAFRSLNFENVGLTDTPLKELSLWLRSSKAQNLHTLILRVNNLEEKSLLHLFSSIRHSMTLLDVSSNFLGSFTPSLWKRLMSRKSYVICIRELNITHNPLTDEDLKLVVGYLKRFVDMRYLNTLCFEDNSSGRKGIEYCIQSFPTDVSCQLRHLTVISLNIRCIGQYLCTWLCSAAASNLHKLQLVNCTLCKRDCAFLVRAFERSPYCQGLRSLRLSGNHDVDDIFVEDFLRVYAMDGILPFLYDVDLSYTGITKIGVNSWLHFFEEHDSYSLRLLNLAYLSMSSHQVNHFHRAFRRVFKGGCLM